MKLSISYGARTIAFTVIFRKRKTLGIHVKPPQVVTVIAPIGTPAVVIKQMVHKKAKWIVQKLEALERMEARKVKRDFVTGTPFLYLGRNYKLQVIRAKHIKKPCVTLYQGKFTIATPTNDKEVLQPAMEQWYRKKTYEQVQQRVANYQPYFNKQPRNIRVKEQKRRWASCTSRGELLFNWRCVMAPAPVLDYIVVHEMCHLHHMNHSRDFWDLVASIMPDYKDRDEWLKTHGVSMDL